MTASEKDLWCAVIGHAIEDLMAPAPGWRQGYNDWQRNKREARLFLTKKAGEWAQSRDLVCSAAGMDPNALRDRILMRLSAAEETNQESAHDKRNLSPVQAGLTVRDRKPRSRQ